MDRVMITPEHVAAQERIARVLEKEWGCDLRRDPDRFAKINYVALRDGTVVAYVLINTRTDPDSRYPGLRLNVKRYRAMMSQRAAGLPVIWVMGFGNDVARYISVDDIVPETPRIGGREPREGVSTDAEPMFEVPVADMKMLMIGP
jgi:hypothetical protein